MAHHLRWPIYLLGIAVGWSLIQWAWPCLRLVTTKPKSHSSFKVC